MSSGVYWVNPPENLKRNIADYGRRVVVAVIAELSQAGAKMQNDARQNAIWVDRTGAARSGLFYAVESDQGVVYGKLGPRAALAMERKTDASVEEHASGMIELYLAHTVFYGRFLELSNGGRYAIVMSTIQRNLPELERQLKRLLQ
jgi:hypothetical protein